MTQKNNIELIFPTPILVKDNVLIDKLVLYKENLLNYFNNNTTEKMFSDSKLENSYFKENKIFENIIYKDLLKEIFLTCNDFCEILGYSKEQISKYTIQNIWANLIKKNDYHFYHTHSRSGREIISGVFYVDAPETANLKFKNIYNQNFSENAPNNENYLNFNYITYKCTPGRLLLFKSNTFHGYDSHLSDLNKLSIAFNFGKGL
jgi:uncharacterized protein (TIGR02466 family)